MVTGAANGHSCDFTDMAPSQGQLGRDCTEMQLRVAAELQFLGDGRVIIACMQAAPMVVRRQQVQVQAGYLGSPTNLVRAAASLRFGAVSPRSWQTHGGDVFGHAVCADQRP